MNDTDNTNKQDAEHAQARTERLEDAQQQGVENRASYLESKDQLRTAAQRKINLIWESTQALIAITIVGANVAAAFILPAGSAMLANGFFLVIGFYFGRTNHTRQGGMTNSSSEGHR